MQKSHMVTDIFQLPQIVRSDHRRQPSLLHFLGENAFYPLTHYRVQPVKGLVTEQILRLTADAADQGELFFHPFGKTFNLPSAVQAKGGEIHVVCLPVKPFIYAAVILLHIARRGMGKKIGLVRDEKASLFRVNAVIGIHSVNENQSLVRLQNARRHPQDGAFPGSIGPDQAEYILLLHPEAHVPYSAHFSEAFGRISKLNHSPSLPALPSFSCPPSSQPASSPASTPISPASFTSSRSLAKSCSFLTLKSFSS